MSRCPCAVNQPSGHKRASENFGKNELSQSRSAPFDRNGEPQYSRECANPSQTSRQAVNQGTDDVWGISLAPRVGLEPTTLRLTAECSTIELPRNDRWAQPLQQRSWNLSISSLVFTGAPFSPALGHPKISPANLPGPRLLISRRLLPPLFLGTILRLQHLPSLHR